VAVDGQRVLASYANFLIINGVVLVPQFRQRPSRTRKGKSKLVIRRSNRGPGSP